MNGSFDFKAFEVVSLEPSLLRRTCEFANQFGFDAVMLHNIDYGRYHLLDYRERWGVEPVDQDAAEHAASWRKQIREGCDLVASCGLQFWLFHHEIKLPVGMLERYGPELLDFDGQLLWELVDWKLESKLALFPNLHGIVFTGTGERMPGHGITLDGAVGGTSTAERFRRMYTRMADLCDRHDKQLILRNHGAGDEGASLNPRPGAFMTAFLEAVEPLRDRVRLMGKVVEPDFQTTYPCNRSLAFMAAQQPTLAEHSLPMEWNGVNRIPYPMVQDIKLRLLAAQAQGCVGTVARIDWDISTHQCESTNSVLGSLNEVNADAFARLSQDPHLSVGRIVDDFVLRRYGSSAVPLMSAMLLDLYRAGNLSHHVFGQRILGPHNVSGGVWRPLEALGHVRYGGLHAWTMSPIDFDHHLQLQSPDAAVLERILAEKDEAIRIYAHAARMMEHQEQAIANSDRQDWLVGLDRATLEAQVHRGYVEAFFCWLWFRSAHDPQVASRCENAIAQTNQFVATHAERYPDDPDREPTREWDSFTGQANAALSELVALLDEDTQAISASSSHWRLADRDEYEFEWSTPAHHVRIGRGGVHLMSWSVQGCPRVDSPIPWVSYTRGGLSHRGTRAFNGVLHRAQRQGDIDRLILTAANGRNKLEITANIATGELGVTLISPQANEMSVDAPQEAPGVPVLNIATTSVQANS